MLSISFLTNLIFSVFFFSINLDYFEYLDIKYEILIILVLISITAIYTKKKLGKFLEKVK